MNKFEDILEVVIGHGQRDDVAGKYDVKFHNSSVEWKGIEYKYHSSGLARIVYISHCRKFVLKIPSEYSNETELDNFKKTGQYFYLSVAASHNLYEAKCYQKAPKKYRKYMAKTELLSNGWVKQEFVDVIECRYHPSLREIGRIGKRYVLFDMDIMLDNFREPFNGFYYEKLPKIINEIKSSLKPR